MHSSDTINTDFRTIVARGKKNLIKKRKIRRLIFPPPFTIQTFKKKKKKKNKRQLLRYKFIAYFPRGMDEIYFTEKVAARIFFLHSRWKSSRENERFCTKVSNVKFLFSRRNRQFFFFFPSYDRMSIDRVICSSFFCGTRFSIAILDPVLSQP